MRELLQDAADRAARYLDSVAQRPVFPTPEAVQALVGLDVPFPAEPTDPAKVLAVLDDVGSPATVATTGGRYFGFVTGGALPATVAANWLAGAWDNASGMSVMSPITSRLEHVAAGWLCDALGLPAGSGVGFTTGATMANLTGLAAARHTLMAKVGWDVEADGLFGAPPLTVVVGDEVHVSVLKALSLLGFGRARVVRVPADEHGRMRADALPALDDLTILCAQAGNVNTGAFDPFPQLVAAAHEAGAWVHVDGAFGLWAAASPSLRHLAAGVEAADSLATDGHKWLNVPYDCGLAFVRDEQSMRAAMAATAAYLIRGEQRDGSDYVPELSRRARGVEVWAALLSLGRSGLADLIERCCTHARRFADELRAAGAEVLNEVVLNQVLVAFGDDDTTDRVVAAVQASGTCWCGPTTWHGRRAMRISVSSWATTTDDVDASVSAITEAMTTAT